MDDSEFQARVDAEFVRIEDRVDELALNLDVDSSGGILTFTLEDGSQIILSRQVANHEIWVAARSGGFHLSPAGEAWHCARTAETLDALLNRVFSEQAGVSVF